MVEIAIDLGGVHSRLKRKYLDTSYGSRGPAVGTLFCFFILFFLGLCLQVALNFSLVRARISMAMSFGVIKQEDI